MVNGHQTTPDDVIKVVINGVNEVVNKGDDVSMEVDEGVNGHPDIGMNFIVANMDINESVGAKTVDGRVKPQKFLMKRVVNVKRVNEKFRGLLTSSAATLLEISK
ncbi:hypothetical protein L1987_18373 [Smallanthus sonchifolius]|uniref:Uncharacterized protein n=1 Tax=Smallanthus sonchifolius TaxID=185202 RepID=A0ACB9J038_9ASTR|nr:hypothetical protein L1987_18373 [Smallanthus sonchifolius]